MKQIKQRMGYRVMMMGMVLTLFGGLLYTPSEKVYASAAVIKAGITVANPNVINNLSKILPILQKWGPALFTIGVGIGTFCGWNRVSPQCITDTLDGLVSQKKITVEQQRSVLLAVMKVCPGCVMASSEGNTIQERLRNSNTNDRGKITQQTKKDCMNRGCESPKGSTIQERLRNSNTNDRGNDTRQKTIDCTNRGCESPKGSTIQERLRKSNTNDRRNVKQQEEKNRLKR